MEVAPEKARKRREKAARDARVERWAEDSGNAALADRELPPAEVLAADQRISWWAKELRKAGLSGSMDELRARAYLDILLGKDSRPIRPASPGGSASPAADGDRGIKNSAADSTDNNSEGGMGTGTSTDGPGDGGPGDGGSGSPDTAAPGTPSGAGGFVGRLNLTVPLRTQKPAARHRQTVQTRAARRSPPARRDRSGTRPAVHRHGLS
jgi:hypothetical protein